MIFHAFIVMFIQLTMAQINYGRNINLTVSANNTGYCGALNDGIGCQNAVTAAFQGVSGDTLVRQFDEYMVYVRYVYNTSVAVGSLPTTASASFFPNVDQYTILNVPASLNGLFVC